MKEINRTTGLLWVMLIFFALYPPLFAWVNRIAIVLSLLPLFYIDFHYSFIPSTVLIAMLIPLNLELIILLGGQEPLQIMKWSNFWAVHIAFFLLGYAIQYINTLKIKIHHELEQIKHLQIQLKNQIQAVQKANDRNLLFLLSVHHYSRQSTIKSLVSKGVPTMKLRNPDMTSSRPIGTRSGLMSDLQTQIFNHII